ncbi:MAG: glycerate kinase [Deltaproteobacteria bacterium HGW-Deltaproteobacteria-17]|nr:MAG: glycerate kinase [Deltaproteobacteria bacterium HGW-Deltaproteobacteria-17]
MRILVAPDSYKLTLDAASAAGVIAAAARAVFPRAEIDECPVADGGEGTLDAWVRARGATVTTVTACDVFGTPLGCPVATDPVGAEVLIEAAHTCGLPPAERRAPGRALSTGLGLALQAVLSSNPAARVRIALGGTGTVDGGLGAAMALGMVLSGPSGEVRPRGILELPESLGVTFSNPFRVPPEFLCDTRAPLLGPSGAVPVFGPQKGVAPEGFPRYEAALERLMGAAARAAGRPFVDGPGCGAAGGVGALFSILTGARCVSGSKYMLSVIEFEQRLMDADLIVTGEGCLDDTSFNGKIVGEIADLCRTARRPLLVLPGRCRLTLDRNARSGDPRRDEVVVRAMVLPDQTDPDKRMVKALLYDAAHSAFRDYSKKQLFQGPGI